MADSWKNKSSTTLPFKRTREQWQSGKDTTLDGLARSVEDIQRDLDDLVSLVLEIRDLVDCTDSAPEDSDEELA